MSRDLEIIEPKPYEIGHIKQILDKAMSSADFYSISAAAVQDGTTGRILNEDYSRFPKIIGDYREKEPSPLWTMGLTKRYATHPVISQAVRNNVASTGPVSRDTLASVPTGILPTVDFPTGGLGDGEEVKAIAGIIEGAEFGRAMQRQQNRLLGNPYGYNADDYEAKHELLISYIRTMNRLLVSGDATANPLEFNGITNLVPDTNVEIWDAITATYPIQQKLRNFIVSKTRDRSTVIEIDCIMASSTGHSYVLNQIENNHIYYNRDNQVITPGFQVTDIDVANKKVPLVSDKWIDDEADVTLNSEQVDILNYYLFFKKHTQWHGVLPSKQPFRNNSLDFEPLVIEINNMVDGSPMLNQMLILTFGTTFLENQGRSMYKLRVAVPRGTIAGGGAA